MTFYYSNGVFKTKKKPTTGNCLIIYVYVECVSMV